MFSYFKEKLGRALAKTRTFLDNKLRLFFTTPIDPERLEELEKLLYEADLGATLAQELTQLIRNQWQQTPHMTSEELLTSLKKELLHAPPPLTPLSCSPQVILIVGVNGNGKTTTAAKLAHRYLLEGKKPLLVAADTFRAAAVEQLTQWAQRLNIDIVKGQQGSDPAAVTFDGIRAGIARQADSILIDTAGRLHTKTPLMHELQKIDRVCDKALPGAPHAIYLVLDATIGQNALLQAETFAQHIPLTGLIITKLDGSAKGGMALAIQRQLRLPIVYIGLGEGLEDLVPFDQKAFVDALFDS